MSIDDILMDAEERNSLARGAMEALEVLLAGQAPLQLLDPVSLTYLFRAVHMVVKDAVLLPGERPRRGANDDD